MRGTVLIATPLVGGVTLSPDVDCASSEGEQDQVESSNLESPTSIQSLPGRVQTNPVHARISR